MAIHEKQAHTVLMVVQGEGRGHFTQAITVHELLTGAGMEVCCVVVGESGEREIPGFFRKKFKVPVVSVPSPHFVRDSNRKSIRPLSTFIRNLMRLPAYLRSARVIHRLVEFHRPSLIINFYEPLTGIYRFLYGDRVKVLSIAHQYVYLHPGFRFPSGHRFEQFLLRTYTKLTALGSNRLLAISMYDLPTRGSGRLRVIPPVLRPELGMVSTRDEGFILVYLVNEGYMEEILEWHSRHPETRLHCFTDSRKVKDSHGGEWRVDDQLTFHSLDDTKFLALMASCTGVATTAGFETVCEAHYLGKPVFMVPVAGHFEQYCNARDAHRAGAGIHDTRFRLGRFLQYLPFHPAQHMSFRYWVNQSGDRIMDALRPLVSQDTMQHMPGFPVFEMAENALPEIKPSTS